jgi:hypothetical protein
VVEPRKIITIWRTRRTDLVVVSRDYKDSLIATIPAQEFGTEPEETHSRQTVIFDNNEFADGFEGPIDGGRNRATAAEVSITE